MNNMMNRCEYDNENAITTTTYLDEDSEADV